MMQIEGSRLALKGKPAWKRHLLLVCLCCALFFGFPATVSAHVDNFPIIGVLHTGGHPEAMAVDMQTHLLYIADEMQGQVTAFDPINGTVRWRVKLGAALTDVQVDSGSHHLYAAAIPPHSKQNTLFVLDGANGQTLAQLPIGAGETSIALDVRRHRVYTVGLNSDTVLAFTFLAGWQSGAIHTQVTKLYVGPRLSAVAVNSRLGRLYVAERDAHIVRVFDEESGRSLADVEVAQVPLAPIRVDEATGLVYVVCSLGEELDVIDGKTNTLIAHTRVVSNPEGVAVNTATGRIYIADEGDSEGNTPSVPSDTITVLDRQTLDSLGTFRVGPDPDGVESDPALERVYVASETDGAVVELSDSVNIPLTLNATTHQVAVAHQTLTALRQATGVIVIAMLLTVVGATLLALLSHWRARGSPRTAPGGESSHSD